MDHEEDDAIRGVGETDEELCPKCNNNLIKPAMFGRQRTLQCAKCKTYLCLKCLSALNKLPGPDGVLLQCPKGHFV
jgi:hypothetical protein